MDKMKLSFDIALAGKYTSASQKIRVMSEDWVLHQVFCPNCGGGIHNYANNKPVADFYCKKCVEDFELKSKNGKIGKKIPTGAYSEMIKRIGSSTKPNFFFMGYLKTLQVESLFVVPKHFFIPEIIEKRKPLATTAKRAGWIGANILFSKIPKAGQIYYVENGKEISKKDVLSKWQKTLFLKKINKSEARGWILHIMNCIDSLEQQEFSLADMYAFEGDLKKLHPDNRNIQAKIRQQLQLLRDKEYIIFTRRGTYRLA